jgi:hypothetical protein
LPEEDPEILARVLLWLYAGDVYRHSIAEEIEKTLAELVPGGPTTKRSKFETCVLVYFCADRQGIESMKLKSKLVTCQLFDFRVRKEGHE